MNKFSIGVDLGGTNLRIAAVDEHGALVEKITLGTKVSLGRDHVIADMCDAIQRMSEKFKNSAPLLGIGIGVPGIIDMQTGLVRESPNLPDWVDYPARAAIEQCLKTVVILENDANVAALGEKWLGAAKDYDDMAMLTLGTGVGGGLVLGGTIWRGANGMAGEFGHTTVEPDGHICGCGNHGCLEQYASATAVVRLAREAFSPAIFEELRLRSMVYAATAPPDPSASHEGASAHVKAGPGHKTIITRALLGTDAGLYGAARLPMITEARR